MHVLTSSTCVLKLFLLWEDSSEAQGLESGPCPGLPVSLCSLYCPAHWLEVVKTWLALVSPSCGEILRHSRIFQVQTSQRALG